MGTDRFGRSDEYPSNSLVDYTRMDSIRVHLVNTRSLGGACAEVGVFRGGTAELIAIDRGEIGSRCYHKERYIQKAHGEYCERGLRPLYLFDTFTGIPYSGKHDNHHKAGDFSDTSFEEVRDRLAKYEGVSIHQGVFPRDTGSVVDDVKFSFVHLDVDVYESYINALNVFYPRMIKGGVIICDDYSWGSTLGAKVAIDEFFESKPEKSHNHMFHGTLVITKL